MFSILFLFISSLIIPLLLNLLKKKNFLSSQTGDSHQKVANNYNSTLAGGVIIVFYFIYILVFSDLDKLIIPLIFIFLIGFLSDINILKSPILRLFLQIIVILFSVIYLNLEILTSRIVILDAILQIRLFNIIFTTFCILILINGFNFIDGLNSLASGYFLLIFLVLLKLNFLDFAQISIHHSYFIIYLIVFIAILNFTNKVFLGDSGAYILGLVSSVLMILLQHQYNNISPFFIVLILWYPSYENLFSIIRKLKFKKDPKKPDTHHLHQLILNYVELKFKKEKHISNNISSFLILFYNSIILLLSTFHIYNSYIQILLIVLNITVYTLIYFLLFRIKKN